MGDVAGGDADGAVGPEVDAGARQRGNARRRAATAIHFREITVLRALRGAVF